MDSPINTVMTPANQCKIFTKDIAMHWYPDNVKIGDTCFCGEVTYKGES